MPDEPVADIRRTYASALRYLAAAYDHTGFWPGRLSSSALSTAVATFALARIDREAHREQIGAGLRWLIDHGNADGGWGDTVDSPSNLSTTLLAWAALTLVAPEDRKAAATVSSAEAWIDRTCGGRSPSALGAALLVRYGQDRTFAAPILTMCALSGRLGPDGLDQVPQLPFELAALPRGLFPLLRLQVVSYALPALIAIGLVRHRHRRGNPCLAWLRDRLTASLLRKLDGLQPPNGGFLEATPLTGFVALSLVAAGETGHPVVQRAAAFLRQTFRRDDGSWPIDTALPTWVTTLAVNALAPGPGAVWLSADRRARILDWLLAQQWRQVHVFTGTAPGGWSWIDTPGGVPDADDTPGALIALHHLDDGSPRVLQAAAAAVRWLCDLQNRDGGIPTFCKGWGRLPFDRSCADLAGHTIRALATWRARLPALRRRLDRTLAGALRFLARTQAADGSWRPLWFGNQTTADQTNPTYGTAVVVTALVEAGQHLPELVRHLEPAIARGQAWLLAAQGPDGGWGGDRGLPPSVEETALALQALALTAGPTQPEVQRAAQWLARTTQAGTRWPASPIGLYFAILWYSELLYPLVWTLAALGRLPEAGPVDPQGGQTGRSDG